MVTNLTGANHVLAAVGEVDWSQLTQLAGWSILPLARLGVLVAIGAFLFRKGILTAPAVSALARLTVALLLPSFIATSILAQFRPGEAFYRGWYFLPLAAVAMIGIFALLAWPIAHIGRDWLRPRCTVATLSFHNAGYLAIPIVTELYARPPLDEHQGPMLALLFLFIMGISPLMWSVGVMAFRGTGGADGEPAWRKAISPPFVASVASVLACLLHIPQMVSPQTLTHVLSPFVLLGNCTVPLMMLILGATLMQLDHSYRPPLRVTALALPLRLVLFPALALGLLSLLLAWGMLDRSKAIILFIESAMPTAVAITVIAHRYGSPHAAQAASGLIFLQYIAAAVTLPVWLMVWGWLYGYGVVSP